MRSVRQLIYAEFYYATSSADPSRFQPGAILALFRSGAGIEYTVLDLRQDIHAVPGKQGSKGGRINRLHGCAILQPGPNIEKLFV